MIELLLLLGSLGLIVACGAFVAAEFALVTVDRTAVDRAVEDGDRRAVGVQHALQTLSTQLSGAQLGITLTNLLIGFLAEPTVADLIEDPLDSVGVPSGMVTGVAFAIALLTATTVTMVIGELVPKNLAIARPLQTASAVQGFMRGFTRVNGPLIRVFNGAANRILHRLGIEPQEELASARSPEELSSLIGRSAEQGTLEQSTATLLQRSLTFGDLRAEDVMTPRTRMRRLRSDASVLAVIELARETGLSRFPVVGENSDDVVGIAHVKHVVAVPPAERAAMPVTEVMVEPVAVPSSMHLDPLLVMLRERGLQMAIVVDEFGGVDGLVTLEDVVEEIVGEVQDEHDRTDPAARRDASGAWVVSGLLRPDEASAVLGVDVPESEEYETIGGLVADHLGRLAAVGDAVELVTLDDEGVPHQLTIEVLRMDGMRVDRLRITKAAA